MSKSSYAETINFAKVMLSGLKSNTERLGRRGLDSDFVTGFEETMNSAMSIDNEQEDLKAQLKMKTASLDTKIDELNKLLSESKKVVKLEIEQESWKGFGIDDQR